jgi:hypothetical protein
MNTKNREKDVLFARARPNFIDLIERIAFIGALSAARVRKQDKGVLGLVEAGYKKLSPADAFFQCQPGWAGG